MKIKLFGLKKGFTIIEMMVVVVIIAILATLVIINYQHSREQSQNSKAMSDLSSIKDAVDMLTENTNHYPGQTGSTVADSCTLSPQEKSIDTTNTPELSPYIGKIPLDPWGRSYYFNSNYTCASGNGCDSGTIVIAILSKAKDVNGTSDDYVATLCKP